VLLLWLSAPSLPTTLSIRTASIVGSQWISSLKAFKFVGLDIAYGFLQGHAFVIAPENKNGAGSCRR
jgi:hypothetical protein